MEENKKKKNIKKSIIIGLMVGLIIGGIGTVSYAMFTYSRGGLENNQLVTGDIWMRYTDTDNVIDLQNAMPSSSYTGGDYFEFEITGKNTYSSPIYYEIVLNHGTVPGNKTEANRIADEFLRFRLVTVTIDTESSDLLTVSPAVNQYYNIDNERIYVGTIAGGGANASQTTTKYRLYCWIDNSVGIGTDYTQSEWNNLFASIRVDVNGDLTEKTIPSRTLITYNANGGTKYPSKKQIATDATTYGTLATPTKDGYTFDGWYSDQELTTKVESTTRYTNGTSATILYAKWKEPLPTMDQMCPGCKFIYTTNTYNYGANGTKINDITENIYDDYNDAITENRHYFLGFTIANNKIDRAFACAFYDFDVPFCVEGKDDASLYSTNLNLLQQFYGSTCTSGGGAKGNCCFGVGPTQYLCKGFPDDRVATTFGINGYVSIKESESSSSLCKVLINGSMLCE